MRRQRVALFRRLTEALNDHVRVLDVGGTEEFWNQAVDDGLPKIDVTLLNLKKVEITRQGFRSVVGDARSLSEFADGEYDVVFSNSVIEHLGSLDGQAAMASECQRVGQHYFIQTPNRYFPIEPHFLFPFFQFLPRQARVRLVRRFDLGWMGRHPDPVQAAAVVDEIRLMTRRELERLFPGGMVWTERFAGMAKSFVVYGGARW
jgi:hypothetical protein